MNVTKLNGIQQSNFLSDLAYEYLADKLPSGNLENGIWLNLMSLHAN